MAVGRVILADLCDPPDTTALSACDEVETALAIERVRARLLRARTRLLHESADRGALDAAIAQLRRLQNPQLGAYRRGSITLLSEPFNGVPGAVVRSASGPARAAIRAMMTSEPPRPLVEALASFGDMALQAAVSAGVSIAMVPEGAPFASFSSSVARCAPAIDDWPSPPSGLFVVDERRILLRARSLRMTAAHEFAHALDAILACKKRSYFSYESEELRYYFATSTGFVNEYAASSLDEYFAESVRAYVEVNDERCAWLPLTRQDFYLRDPRMFALVERLFRSGLSEVERRSGSRADHAAWGSARRSGSTHVDLARSENSTASE